MPSKFQISVAIVFSFHRSCIYISHGPYKTIQYKNIQKPYMILLPCHAPHKSRLKRKGEARREESDRNPQMYWQQKRLWPGL